MICVLDAWFFVEMVNDNDLAFLIFIVIELWNELISFDVSSRAVQSLFDVILLVLFGFSKVDQKKISLKAHWQLLSFYSHRSEIGGLASCIFFGFVPLIN